MIRRMKPKRRQRAAVKASPSTAQLAAQPVQPTLLDALKQRQTDAQLEIDAGKKRYLELLRTGDVGCVVELHDLARRLEKTDAELAADIEATDAERALVEQAGALEQVEKDLAAFERETRAQIEAEHRIIDEHRAKVDELLRQQEQRRRRRDVVVNAQRDFDRLHRQHPKLFLYGPPAPKPDPLDALGLVGAPLDGARLILAEVVRSFVAERRLAAQGRPFNPPEFPLDEAISKTFVAGGVDVRHVRRSKTSVVALGTHARWIKPVLPAIAAIIAARLDEIKAQYPDPEPPAADAQGPVEDVTGGTVESAAVQAIVARILGRKKRPSPTAIARAKASWTARVLKAIDAAEIPSRYLLGDDKVKALLEPLSDEVLQQTLAGVKREIVRLHL